MFTGKVFKQDFFSFYRLMPVQITIPAQPGHPNSMPRALTVQVPAFALQPVFKKH